MKIVQLLPELNEGGVERGTVELSREMVKRGIDSIVISAGGKLAEQIDTDGGRHICFDLCSKNPLTAPLRIYQLRKLLEKVAPDILHARSRVPAWIAYLANKTLTIPFVTTVHGFNSVNAYSRVMIYGDRVICVSNAIKGYIQQHYQVPDEKISVIPRGVDLELFDPKNIDQEFILRFKEKYQLDDRFVVTSVGRITQLKDYETFIRGLVAAKEKIPNICGLIVGGVRQDKQGYFAFLRNIVTEFGANGFIHFAGSHNKIAEIFSLSDILVVCSKKPESFGRTAAEALAMNVPVIATNHGGILDIVREGETGSLFSVGDYERLSGKIASIQKMSFLSLRDRVVEEFSLEQMVEKTVGVYRDIFP
ncbi:MAG: glycosyltransferase family 4 protein [Desulfuromusa sp.]|nr:glycosyltransferase family 4 protein [Desulfuromusa sp.]